MSEKTDRTLLVMVEGKYAMLVDGRNWVVADLKDTTSQIQPDIEDFDKNSYTYHMNIRQAIIELSRRLLKDSLSKACKDRALKLNELVEVIKANDQWMRKAIMGRSIK